MERVGDGEQGTQAGGAAAVPEGHDDNNAVGHGRVARLDSDTSPQTASGNGARVVRAGDFADCSSLPPGVVRVSRRRANTANVCEENASGDEENASQGDDGGCGTSRSRRSQTRSGCSSRSGGK
mmetsp:Transcript_30900/g.47717  ORF Transcript_30900/g.47717 Transcript_30900/m.47717 type:complete len:124 (+) Transcript_30900:2530-2901(+)